MAHTYPVPRWAFLLPAGNRDIRFEEVGGPGVSVQTLPGDTYVISGDNSAGPPVDLCLRFKTAIEAAHVAIYGAGPGGYDVTLTTNGEFSITNGMGNDIDIAFDHAATTFGEAQLGFENLTYTIGDGLTVTSPFMAHYQWHAGIWPLYSGVLDTGSGFPQRSRHMVRSLDGTPHEIIVVADEWHEEMISWRGIPLARMIDAAAASSAYAAYAGIATGESQTLEALWDYLDVPSAPTTIPYPQEVYVYSTNDPTTAVRSTLRYRVIREGEWLRGIPAGRLSQEYAAASMDLDLRLVTAS